ncbi:MAG: non-homologous end-joining DNA ligase, partial [Actinomycetota bacterium]|nr:non-homologous end-joining DNA ligase [Actinomycetota bacterium]
VVVAGWVELVISLLVVEAVPGEQATMRVIAMAETRIGVRRMNSGYGAYPLVVTSIRFGISVVPPDDGKDAAFLDDLVEQGHRALELPFVTGFPWKEKRCRTFGELAAARDIRLSVHAPYFAVLTVQEEDKGAQCLAALEHTMKLGKWLGAPVIVAHLGNTHGEDPAVLMERVRTRLTAVESKVVSLGVGLGLETAGSERSFGSLGDIAQLAGEFSFVRPVIDWAHVHAITGGGLTSKEAFLSVFAFLKDSFPGWMIQPLHAQFTDNEFGKAGEIRHIPYGTGSLRVTPLLQAALEAGVSMNLISEARENESHVAIWDEAKQVIEGEKPMPDGDRFLSTSGTEFPDPVPVRVKGQHFVPVGTERPIRLSNVDKPFFPDDGYTKGDLIQYYSSVASVLLPHLAGRPISMSRYPDGIGGPSFYEKRAPGHQPDWMRTVPVPSDSQGGIIEFLLADSREALMWFANMGCVEVHPFHSTFENLDFPDYAIFDFDPSEGSVWDQVVAAAKLLEIALRQLGLTGYPKLSGSRGLHVYVPLEPVHDYSRVRRFVGEVGAYLAAANPEDITMEWDKPKRKGRVFVDHNRNAFGQTVASVYSVRPRPGAPVAAPLSWEEVGTMKNGDVTIANLWDRLQRFGDPFAPVLGRGQTLDSAESALGIADGAPA